MRLVEESLDEVGFNVATLEISDRYAYGYLKSEQGSHQIKRISPFTNNPKPENRGD